MKKKRSAVSGRFVTRSDFAEGFTRGLGCVAMLSDRSFRAPRYNSTKARRGDVERVGRDMHKAIKRMDGQKG